MATTRQGLTLFSALLFFVAAGVVVQTWLLWNAVDALMGRRYDVLLPTLIGSLGVLVVNAGLLAFVFHFDAKLKQPPR